MSSNDSQSTVQVAVVQAGSIPFDADACVDKAVRLIGEAAGGGSTKAGEEAPSPARRQAAER